MNCPNCGGTVPPNSQRCLKCGSFVEQPSAPPQQNQQQQLPPAPHMPQAPYGYQPKSKLTAGLLGIFLGGLGIHRFYLGYTGIGIAQIIVSSVTWGFGSIWGLIEGILILTGSTITTDAKGVPLTD